MNNPGIILKLWNKAVKLHEGDKDPKSLPKKGQDQKFKIKKGLTTLKLQGTKLTSQEGRDRFALMRDKTGALMTKYCRYLKAAKDEDKKALPKYLKTVKRLTLVVLNLDPGNLSDADEDGSLDALDAVDDTALDARMAAPDTGEDEDLDEPLRDDVVPEADPNAVRWEERSRELEPRMLEALKSGLGDGSKMRAVWAFATEKAGAGDYAKALLALDNLEKLLPVAKGAKSEDLGVRFAALLKALLPDIQAAVAKKLPAAQDAKLKASEAAVFGRKKEYAQGIRLLEEARQLLDGAATDDGGDEYEEMFRGLWETLNDDLPQLQRTNPSVAATVEQIMTAADGHASKGDFQKAYTFLDRASTAVAKAASAGRAAEAASEIPEGKVAEVKAAFEKARVRWDAALAAARARLQPVQAKIKANFPQAATGLNNILDSYEQELLDELQGGQAMADKDGVAAAVKGTLGKVRGLRAEAAGDNVFTFLEECGVPVKAAFAKAFDEVEALLQV